MVIYVQTLLVQLLQTTMQLLAVQYSPTENAILQAIDLPTILLITNRQLIYTHKGANNWIQMFMNPQIFH